MQILKYILIITIIFTAFISKAQVTVALRQPPQYQFKVEDFWKVTLNNTSQETNNVYLYGIATSTVDGKIVDANTKIFSLKPGMTVVTGSVVSPIKIIEKNKKYEDALSVTGGLPTGDYDICLTVYNADNNEILGYECISHSVEIISGIELLMPENKVSVIKPPRGKEDWDQDVGKNRDWKEEEDEDLDSYKKVGKNRAIEYNDNLYVNGLYITFSWLAPSPAPRGGKITYNLTITEMLLNQSAYDALQSNPEFYKSANLSSTIYQYPFMSRGFKNGRKYAWKVTAYLNGVKMTESEVNEFEYSDGKKPRPIKVDWDWDLGYNPNSLIAGSNTLQLKKKVSLFKFGGEGRIYGENSNMEGIGSDIPQRYMNFELTPTLSIHGVPFSLPILLSTQNQDSMQNMNSVAFQFDPSSLKDIVQNKVESELEKYKDDIEQKIKDKGEKFRDEIEKQAEDNAMKKLPGILKFFSYFQSLGLGTTYPVYTTNTISGVPVTGANVEFNPGIIYTAFTGFKNQAPIDNNTFKRNLFSGRLGVGKKDKSHFIMTLMHAFDDENSITVDSANLTLTPKENWLVGMDGKLNLFKDKLSLEAEGVLSMLTRDVRDPDIISDAIPQWVKNMFKPKGSSSADYMYRFKGAFTNEQSNTVISAEMKMIGPGFITLGNPSLRNDKLGFEAKIDQKFLDRKVIIGLSFRNYRDNLINTKTATTSSTSILMKLGLNFKNLPTLNIMVMPNFQSNDKQITTTDSSKMDNKTWLYNIVSTYSAKLGNVTLQTTALVSYNTNKTLFGTYDYWTKTTSLTENIMFKFPLSVAASIGLIQVLERDVNYTRVITFDLAPNYTFKEMWNISGGLNVTVDKDNNKKISLSLNTNTQLWKFLTFDMRAEHNVYTDWSYNLNNYKEFIFRTTLSAGW
ncbi:MAG: hypothetical protein EHM58_00360 [Ignavibacteriae bacterium]|nr:MAG: hypothetical protein EHM58_00360 [Ignavibacteriota bacterium]